MKPETYHLKSQENPGHQPSYVYKSDTHFNTTDAETTYTCSFDYNEQFTSVTYFPDRPGVKLAASDSPNERIGRSRAIFGLIIMKLILSGEMWVKEL